MSADSTPHISRWRADITTGLLTGRTSDEAAIAALALTELVEQLEVTRTALEVLLDHAERIQEHVPKSENWYAVRDYARIAPSNPAISPDAGIEFPDDGSWNDDCWKGYEGCRCKVEDVHTSAPASKP